MSKSNNNNSVSEQTNQHDTDDNSHAINWQKFNKTSIQNAQSKDQLIFLHMGNPSCLECQYMQYEVFKDPNIIKIMNEYFVNIKVDNETRPDLFHFFSITEYITSKSQGLPLNVILTPDFQPIFAISFTDQENLTHLIDDINYSWIHEKDTIYKQANQFASITKTIFNNIFNKKQSFPKQEIITEIFNEITTRYDNNNHGFISNPKYFEENAIAFLIDYANFINNAKSLEMAQDSLDRIATSPMHDIVNGGFFHKSTSENWNNPIFVKKLYNQIQLSSLYLELFNITKNKAYKNIATSTIKFILQKLHDPNQGFYSAIYQDFNSNTNSYLVNDEDLDLISNKAKIKFDQNFILYNLDSESFDTKEKVISAQNIHSFTIDDYNKIFSNIRESKQENQNIITDHKVLTSWNSLMIKLLINASDILSEPQYLDQAETTLNIILERNYRENLLYRFWESDEVKQVGLFEDYSYLISSIVSLYQKTKRAKYLNLAQELTKQTESIFYDQENFSFYFTKANPIWPQIKLSNDNVIASSISTMLDNYRDLYKITNQEIYILKYKKNMESLDYIMKNAPFDHLGLWRSVINYYENN
ncbi:DUF255 domain-containing protein [Rickettsiales bacterium]|nr:DUF255 domain-containing protein [Rickettsiales bacterium]